MKVVRISDFFKLPYRQGELPFVDVDITGDSRLFLDPSAIRFLHDEWYTKCVYLLQTFFESVLNAIRLNDHDKAKRLLSPLREPNETHLGLSQKKAQGRGLGSELANEVWKLLSESNAVKTGLLVDLEDTALLINKIGPDIISDITTNVIRGQLIIFTQNCCRDFNIPMTKGVDSGALWDPVKKLWYSELIELPVVNDAKLLLVPKEIVRKNVTYSHNEYLNTYILEKMQEVELSANSSLVQLLKNGSRIVTKTSLKKKYGSTKQTVVLLTQQHPEVLQKYKTDKLSKVSKPLTHEAFDEDANIEVPRWRDLLNDVLSTPSGKKFASVYHNNIERILSPLMYPDLINPAKEQKIHNGRKRIDISYTNMGNSGFMKWLLTHYCAPHIFIECKNYEDDIANIELDQISSRFSPSRGQVGLLLCRKFKNKELFIQRCIDTAKDQRGYIIVLDDIDLKELVEYRIANDEDKIFNFWKKRFDQLIM